LIKCQKASVISHYYIKAILLMLKVIPKRKKAKRRVKKEKNQVFLFILPRLPTVTVTQTIQCRIPFLSSLGCGNCLL